MERQLLQDAFTPARAWAASSTVVPSTNAAAAITDLVIAKRVLSIAGRRGLPTVVNGLLPGPVLRFREGETVTIRVKNELEETSSIHWHGLIVPVDMDGVPGVSFKREFAPYLGVSYKNTFGQTAQFARERDEAVRGLSVVAGIRAWF